MSVTTPASIYLRMQSSEIVGVLEFLRTAEGLKTATRSGWTSASHPVLVAVRALLDEDTEGRARESDTSSGPKLLIEDTM